MHTTLPLNSHVCTFQKTPMALSVARGHEQVKQASRRRSPVQMCDITCAVVLLLTSVRVKAQLDLPPYDDYGDAAQRQKTENAPFNGDIKRLLQALDVQASQQCTNNVAAQWNFETNVNEHTQLEAVSEISSH